MTPIDIYSQKIDTIDILRYLLELEEKLDILYANGDEDEERFILLDEQRLYENVIETIRATSERSPESSVTLIASNHLEEHLKGIAYDDGLPEYVEVNWMCTIHKMRQDYTSIEIEGQTFWYR